MFWGGFFVGVYAAIIVEFTGILVYAIKRRRKK